MNKEMLLKRLRANKVLSTACESDQLAANVLSNAYINDVSGGLLNADCWFDKTTTSGGEFRSTFASSGEGCA